MQNEIQQDLPLDMPTPLSVIRLTAHSPRQAFYIVEVIRLAGAGYVIQKSLGAQGAKPVVETWFRLSYASALQKQQMLVKLKLCKKKGRLYQIQSEKR